jgi:hypothetical protein
MKNKKNNWEMLQKNFNTFFFIFKPIKKIYMSYFSPLAICLKYHEQPLSEYLTAGTNIPKDEMQEVINRIKRDKGFKSESIAAEETYFVKKFSFVIAKYSLKTGNPVAVSYFIIKNNPELYKKLMDNGI